MRFEISEGTRASLDRWMQDPVMVGSEYLWPGRFHERLQISTRQYSLMERDWMQKHVQPTSKEVGEVSGDVVGPVDADNRIDFKFECCQSEVSRFSGT